MGYFVATVAFTNNDDKLEDAWKEPTLIEKSKTERCRNSADSVLRAVAVQWMNESAGKCNAGRFRPDFKADAVSCLVKWVGLTRFSRPIKLVQHDATAPRGCFVAGMRTSPQNCQTQVKMIRLHKFIVSQVETPVHGSLTLLTQWFTLNTIISIVTPVCSEQTTGKVCGLQYSVSAEITLCFRSKFWKKDRGKRVKDSQVIVNIQY